MDKIGIAKAVREQKREEANMLAGALLDAEARMGELIKKIEKQPTETGSGGRFGGSKKVLPEGITHKQSSAFQTLAENKDIIEDVKADAEADDDLPTRTEVLRRVKEANKGGKIQKKKDDYIKASKNYKEKDIKIIEGDFRQTKVDDNSIDLILTDPPYPKEFLPLWEAMFEQAARILKPSRFLVTYANHQNLDQIFKLKNDLIYYWIFKLDFTQKPIAMGRNLIATWKPVLIFQKKPFHKIEETIEDNVKEYEKFTAEDRNMHDDNWAQSTGKFEYLIDKFSAPGELILDPFTGTGTTLVAAKRMKRKCIGVEIEHKYIDLIKGRLCDDV
jgi:16S rRNA G966 N2-methylase RsmD